MTTKTIRADVINHHQLTLFEVTDLLNTKQYIIKVEKDNKVLSEQTFEALDIALAIYDGMQVFYEKQ